MGLLEHSKRQLQHMEEGFALFPAGHRQASVRATNAVSNTVDVLTPV